MWGSLGRLQYGISIFTRIPYTSCFSLSVQICKYLSKKYITPQYKNFKSRSAFFGAGWDPELHPLNLWPWLCKVSVKHTESPQFDHHLPRVWQTCNKMDVHYIFVEVGFPETIPNFSYHGWQKFKTLQTFEWYRTCSLCLSFPLLNQ
jgi:hypothetical protein